MAAEEAGRKRGRFLGFSRRRSESPFHMAKIREAEIPVLDPKKEADAIVELMPLRRGALRMSTV